MKRKKSRKKRVIKLKLKPNLKIREEFYSIQETENGFELFDNFGNVVSKAANKDLVIENFLKQ